VKYWLEPVVAPEDAGRMADLKPLVRELMSLKTARARIIHYIETEGANGTVALSHSKKEWAAELGLTHEALYRTLASMERSGEISTEGAKVTMRY
jgi:CRP/FNR family transcriptional regulator, dissimilatory nitrate respiration regulator